MKTDKKKWLKYLEMYGGDFDRWPEFPPAAIRDEIKNSAEYSEEIRTDAILCEMEWPELSESLYAGISERIRNSGPRKTPETERISGIHALAGLRPYVQQAMLLSMLALFMFLGASSGVRLNSKAQDYMSYAYFSIGPAYIYGRTAGGADE